MKKNKKVAKIQKTIYYIFGVLLLLLITLFIFANTYFVKLIEKEIKSQINQNSNRPDFDNSIGG